MRDAGEAATAPVPGGATHVEEFTIRSYLVDSEVVAGPPALGRLMQEAAIHHADTLGMGVGRLLAEGRSWVLAGSLLRCERLPGLGERVRVETWPRGAEGRAALREFVLRDAAGGLIALATTSWLVIDLARRRPLPLAAVRPEGWPVRPEAVLGRAPARLGAWQGAGAAAGWTEMALTVRRSDLDLIGHVNNAAWIDFALEAVPERWGREHTVRELEIDYLAEARRGDPLVLRVGPDPSEPAGLRHEVLHARGGRPALRARSLWRPRSAPPAGPRRQASR